MPYRQFVTIAILPWDSLLFIQNSSDGTDRPVLAKSHPKWSKGKISDLGRVCNEASGVLMDGPVHI